MWFHVPFRQILHKLTSLIVVKIRGIPRIQLQAVYTAAHFRKWSVNCESTVRFRAVENSQLRVVSFESDSLRVRLHGHQMRVNFRKWVAFESEAIVRTRQMTASCHLNINKSRSVAERNDATKHKLSIFNVPVRSCTLRSWSRQCRHSHWTYNVH